MSSNNRIIQFDALRIIAAIAVVWLHTSAQRFYDCYPSLEWDARNFYDSLVRWAVPVFVMVSGALFLDPQKKIKIKILYNKNIIRIILIFVFWSIIYSTYTGLGEKGIIGLFERMIQGPFHFWFLKMLIGLYIAVPILRTIVSNKNLEEYFICLSIATAFLIPMLFPLIGYISDVARDFSEKYFNELGIKIASGHVGYFVLGHYLANNPLKKRVKINICILGVLSVISVCILTHLASNRAGAPHLLLYGNINLFTLFEAMALFIIIKDIPIAFKYHTVVIGISKLSLGIYIIHPLVMNILFDLCNIDSAYLNPIYFIPIFAISVFIISLSVSCILVRIPVIKRFMM
ncbi:acyltransferase [uncultured Methanobrevibacter sp.]|uniref:acyltransferase n=1 Tax=uncultured Methanobrevibacter sp. TaxID=253161 RepID=UPI0025F51767|nr:acyltransferase family protein [uncultured Methanobrevibacter sp.]